MRNGAIPTLASASRKARSALAGLEIRFSLGFFSVSLRRRGRQACVSDKLPPLVDDFALPDFSVVFGDAMLLDMMARQACRRVISANKHSLAASHD